MSKLIQNKQDSGTRKHGGFSFNVTTDHVGNMIIKGQIKLSILVWQKNIHLNGIFQTRYCKRIFVVPVERQLCSPLYSHKIRKSSVKDNMNAQAQHLHSGCMDNIKRGCWTGPGESAARERAVSHQEMFSRQVKRLYVLDQVSIHFMRRFSGRTRGFTFRLSLNSSLELWSNGQDNGFHALSEFGAHNLKLKAHYELL